MNQRPTAALLLFALLGPQPDQHRSWVTGHQSESPPREQESLVGKIVDVAVDAGQAERGLLVKLDGRTLTIPLKLESDIVSPNLKVWLRNGNSSVVYDQVPEPSCLYSGSAVVDDETIDVAISTCSKESMGTLIRNERVYKIVSDSRRRRSAEDADNSLVDELLIIEREINQGECGINGQNKKRLRVDETPIVSLLEENDREKRAASQKYIEVAVFIDDVMYNNVDKNKAPGEDTVNKIVDIVYAYLNAVQIMYKSDKLSTSLNLVLVRLDIMQSPDATLSKHDGDIELYLDSFCGWQKMKNPGGDLTNQDHWDHALLLTGLNLYDRKPERDSVIGLAWVSGMCHPEYSCTINEGNNFESVFVIAHEMGHNLGMNHDGESQEGNTCSPNKYLMSAVLGPGKVSWSPCSDAELTRFLSGSVTRVQAGCMDDIPNGYKLKSQYNADSKLPGEKFSALEQCRQSFGQEFRPHVKAESPYENPCRELWCSNLTHALRAHPALEGTDCSSKPYPYGSVCREGVCTPFLPPTAPQQPVPNVGTNIDPSMPSDEENVISGAFESNLIDDAPAWYDPIFAKAFTSLREELMKSNPELSSNYIANFRRRDNYRSHHLKEGKEEAGIAPLDAPSGLAMNSCPVACGGGWVDVINSCSAVGDESLCETDALQPQVRRLPCATLPCDDVKIGEK